MLETSTLMGWKGEVMMVPHVQVLDKVYRHQNPWQELCSLQDKCLLNKQQDAYLYVPSESLLLHFIFV